MCPEHLGFISICILWNIIYRHVKATAGARCDRWGASSALGNAASSSLGFRGGVFRDCFISVNGKTAQLPVPRRALAEVTGSG